MKRVTTSLLLLLLGASLQAQLSDTIYAHENVTVSLLFPERISLTDIGSSDFMFEYEGNLLIIKAKGPSKGFTSLLVRYGETAYFTGYLGYRAEPRRFYFDYREKLPLSDKELLIADSVSAVRGEGAPYSQVDTLKLKEELVKILQVPTGLFATRRKKRQGLIVELEAMCNSDELTLLRLRVRNKSSLPYQVAYAGLRLEEKSSSRGLAGLSREIKPVISRVPAVILPHSAKTFAFAYRHFAPSKRTRLILTLREKQGTRAIELMIPARYVLHANPI